LLPVIDIDYSISFELAPKLTCKGSGRLFKNPFRDASTEMNANIEEVRSENEDRIEDLVTEIDLLKSTMDDLHEKIAELHSKSDAS